MEVLEKEIRSKEDIIGEIEAYKRAIDNVDIRLNKIKEELEKVEELEKNKVWKPQKKEMYWYTEATGNIVTFAWEDDRIDKWNYSIGNYFKTEEEAERRKFELELEGKARLFRLENNEEIDWNDRGEAKYYLYYNTDTRKILVQLKHTNLNADKLGYFSSYELASQFIDDNKEDLIKYFEGMK